MISDQLHHRRLTPVLAIIAVFSITSLPAADQFLEKWDGFSRSRESKRLMEWLGKSAQDLILNKKIRERLDVSVPAFHGKLGIFITVVAGRDIRGCYGSFSPVSPVFETVALDYLKGALFSDPRHKPLDESDMSRARIILTVASHPVPVEDPAKIDSYRYGITLECGSEISVYVPGEIKYISFFDDMPKCQLSAFRAVTLETRIAYDRIISGEIK